MIKEQFKPIPNYENLYEVSNLGRVRSLRRNKTLKPSLVRGQPKVVLSVNSTRKMYAVSQLVAMAFLNHTPNGYNLIVDHLNNEPTDNRLENLQLITNRENLSKDKKNKTSQYTGVSWNKAKGKWIAQINQGKTKFYLGQFDCELKAHLAYQNKLKQL